MIIFRAEWWGYEEGFEVTIERQEDGSLVFRRQGVLMLAGGEHDDEVPVTEDEALELMADFSDCEVSPYDD